MPPKKTSHKRADSPSRQSTAKRTFVLHLITAGGGNVVGDLMTAMITQFPDTVFQKTHHPFQDTLEKVKKTLSLIKGPNTLVVHALVDPRAKQRVRQACVPQHIAHYDLTGPLVHFLADHIGVLPSNDLSPMYQIDEDYFRRIEAVEFTMQHDDGLGLETLDGSEIVLVGLSRVSKSPTSIFLASRGYKTANVSISPQTGFPDELLNVKNKIVALTVQPKRLSEIRAARIQEKQCADIAYRNLPDVIREVIDAETEYRKRRYPILDITEMTVEQTAAKVLETLKIKRR